MIKEAINTYLLNIIEQNIAPIVWTIESDFDNAIVASYRDMRLVACIYDHAIIIITERTSTTHLWQGKSFGSYDVELSNIIRIADPQSLTIAEETIINYIHEILKTAK